MNLSRSFRLLSFFLAVLMVFYSVAPSAAAAAENELQVSVSPEMGSAAEDGLMYESESQPTEPVDETFPTAPAQTEPEQIVYQQETILIYNFEQLLLIGSDATLMSQDNIEVGSGAPVLAEDGTTITYSPEACYSIASDIPLPPGECWTLPEDFTGWILPAEPTDDRTVYDAQTDTIYIYNPYQLAVMAMDNAAEQPVLSNDMDAATVGMGTLFVLEDGSFVTYGPEHNYVISSQFDGTIPEQSFVAYSETEASEVTEPTFIEQTEAHTELQEAEDPADLISPMDYDAVYVTDDFGADPWGRDFPGQVLKYDADSTEPRILIGSEAQLREIGSGNEVYTQAFEVKYSWNWDTEYFLEYENGKPRMLYGGDADYQLQHNHTVDTGFRSPKDDSGAQYYHTGVDQRTGEIYQGVLSRINDTYKTDVEYAMDARYTIFRDIELTQGKWDLTDEFSGEIQPAVTPDTRTLYEVDESGHVTIYIHHPLQLNRLNLAEASNQAIYENDAYVGQFGTGEQVVVNGQSLTYSSEHTYVISQYFSSDIPETATMVGNDIWGRDFPGQVVKTIAGEQYILIGNAQQLRAIGTDAEVYGAVYQTYTPFLGSEKIDWDKNDPTKETLIMRYSGDADLVEDHNGVGDYEFHTVNDSDSSISGGGGVSKGKAGVNQETGEINTKLDEKTGVKYSSTANYIIFRDIDLNNEAWTPLMFSGTMIGAESPRDYTMLWDRTGPDAAKITVTARPTISNITVDQTAKMNTEKYIGVGFFATITNEVNVANVGVSSGTVKVSNLELHNVTVNTATNETAAVNQTLVNGLLSTLGGLLGELLELLLGILTFGQVKLNLSDTLSSLLNARAADPTTFATGAFAGRIVGDVLVEDCDVTGVVQVSNINDRTGGFVGYTEGMTVYEGLSKALGGITDFLSALLNVIPGLGLGDLITILLENALPLNQLIPTDYINPKITNCNVIGLTGTVGQETKQYAGGFVGQQVGTIIDNCTVQDSTYTVQASAYGGGFSGLARDADIQGLLSDVGIELLRVAQPQSVLLESDILNSNVTVTGGDNLGGFVGALASSYAINNTVTGKVDVNGTGSDIGGFAGTATVGWATNLGKNDVADTSLLSTVRELLTGLLSNDPSKAEMLLSLVGISPSAIMGCQMDCSSVTVHADGSYAGGIVGKADGLYLTESSAEYLEELAFWKYDALSGPSSERPCSLTGLESVSAGGDYAGGIAGSVGTASVGGLLNGTLGLAEFLGFTVDNVTVTGVDSGYAVSAAGNYAGGGFGEAVGGVIQEVALDQLQSVAANNRAGGFVGVAGPGDLAGAGGLKLSLLGLDILKLNNLLALGQGIEVEIKDSTVTGIADGYTVTATGSNSDGEVVDFTAAGFIAKSNSTTITNSHAYNLKQVIAADKDGYAGGFIGTSETGGLADVADEESLLNLLEVNGLVDAVGYLIPEYTNCTVSYVDGGGVQADVAGGFVADLQSGTVSNEVRGEGDYYSVYNLDHVDGQSYAGGFGGKVYSGALADAGGGLSILGGLDLIDLSINVSDLLGVVEAYVPFVEYAGVYSENGFTVSAPITSETDVNSGAAGGFIGWASGAQVSHCDVNRLKHTTVIPPDDLEAVEAPTYFNGQSSYAVMGGRYAGGFMGNMDIGSAASLGGGLEILGESIQLTNVLDALSVVVTTVEHSDVYGGPGGFAVLSDGKVGEQTVGMAGGFAGNISGGHVQDSNVHNFSYIIGEIAAGGYVGNFVPGNVANVLNDTSILGGLVDLDSALASVAEDFVPTIRNSSTDSIPCGGAVRAHAPSDASVQRGMAGGYVGHNEGGHIWGLNTDRWKEEETYSGPTSVCKAERIRSVYGYEYAGGFTGLMECADTAQAGGLSILGGLIQVGNLLNALEVLYPTEENTAVYGPLANLDVETWNSWVQYVGQYGGYGAVLAAIGEVSSQEQLNAILQDYIYGYHVVAGRSFHETNLISEGGDAGGYVGLMSSGTITNGQAYDAKLVRAMRSTGGFAGKMLTGGAAEFGTVDLLGIIKLNLGELLNVGQVFVPVIKNSSVRGYRAGLTVLATGTDHVHGCGYAGGYAGSVYGGQIWGEESGCDVVKLLRVRGTNAVGGYVGLATAGSVAGVNTNASDGLLQSILNFVIGTPDDLASVLQATLTTIRGASVSPADAQWGFVVDGEYETGEYADYVGGFAGALEAAVLGEEDGSSELKVTGLRSVNGGLYAGGFFGLADVTSVAQVSGSGENQTTLLGILQLGQLDVLSAFRTYVYHASVEGVEEGIWVRAHTSDKEGLLDSTRYAGCAGGFGGGLMNGSVKNSDITNLSTVEGLNYVGGFIGHMGKNGVVDLDDASLSTLLGLQAGVLDVFGSHVDNCHVTGIPEGYIIQAQGGSESIAGGFVGFADVSRIDDSSASAQKKVNSDQIAGGFIGRTERSYLVDVDVDSPLLAVVLWIVNGLLDVLHTGDLENLGVIDIGLPGFELDLLSDGNLLYVNLLGIRIGVSLSKGTGEGGQDQTLIHIGDSQIILNYSEGEEITDKDLAEAQIKLFKGNRTEVKNCRVDGVAVGYDVFGGGASDSADGTHSNGHSGGFVGLNDEGLFENNSMYWCDTVRGTSGQVGPFSGTTVLDSVYDFNTIESIEGENNTYRIYRGISESIRYALTADLTQIGTEAAEDGRYNRFDVTHLADFKTFAQLEGAVMAEDISGSGAVPLEVYVSDAKAVLMDDRAVPENQEGLVPEPGEVQDPCEETIDLTIQKIWKDWNNWDKLRPDSITVNIYQSYTDRNGEEVKKLYREVQLCAEDSSSIGAASWRKVINDLPVAFRETDPETGEEHIFYYSYSVEEVAVEGYTTTIVFDSREQVATITNIHQPRLPFTGAGGDLMYVGVGAAMILLGAVKKRPRNKKQKGRNKMKNATRKLIAIVMALALVMSLSITAFAANPTTGTLTVHGEELGGKNVTAVLMFNANVLSSDDLIGEGDSVGYELVAVWQEFIDGQLNKAADANATSEEAYNYVKDLTGNALISFAEDAMKYAKANGITGTTAKADDTSDTATFTNLTAGYYVVYPDAGSTSTIRGTEAMLVNVPSQKASELEIKSVYPTVDKTVDTNGDSSYTEDESAQIGDTVKFQLSSEVPEMSDYKTYEFNFVDTMSAGLTYKDGTVKVTIGVEEVTPSRVTYENNILRVEFDDLKSIDGVTAGEAILVTYSATVNGNAVVGANTNKAKVEYSNNPDFDGNPGEGPTGDSDEDDADVYTFEIVVDKYAMVDGSNTKLSGAVFTLKDKDGNVINLVVKDAENNVYRIATADDPTESIVTQVTTDANGAVNIEGLEEGTYYLEEIVAPTGYNKLAEDVKIVITADYTKTPVEVSYKVGNEEATISSSIPVENKTGAVLPETGSIGTIGLTVFGVMVVVLGIALPRKKNARA